jgi:tRNA A58 N-methylase Trm61
MFSVTPAFFLPIGVHTARDHVRGAGSGLFSRPLAKAVGPSGKVYAADIQQDRWTTSTSAIRQRTLATSRQCWASFDDPKLPVRDVDLARRE